MLTPPKTSGGKETPSLFKKKKKEVVQEVSEESRSEEYSEEELQAAWKGYSDARREETSSEMQRLIMDRRVEKIEGGMKIFLNSALETAILERMEHDVIAFLRNALKNDTFVIEKEVREEEVKQKLYTSRDKYEYMIEQNPDLKYLKERLGLDFEY